MMLTWAIVYLIIHGKTEPGLGLFIAMFCDVGIVHYVAAAFAGRAR